MKEDNPFNRFDSKPSSDSKNPFDQFDAPSDVSQAAPAAPKERGTYEKTKEGFLEVLPKNSHLFLGPMVVGGVGELLKGGGAAIELVAPETGKKVREYGRGIVGAVNERYPISGTIGEIGSYALPYGLATKGIQALRGAPAVSTLGRAAEAGGAGGAEPAAPGRHRGAHQGRAAAHLLRGDEQAELRRPWHVCLGDAARGRAALLAAFLGDPEREERLERPELPGLRQSGDGQGAGRRRARVGRREAPRPVRRDPAHPRRGPAGAAALLPGRSLRDPETAEGRAPDRPSQLFDPVDRGMALGAVGQ